MLDPHLPSGLESAATFVCAYWLFTCLHEGFHVAAACVIGHAKSALTAANLLTATCYKRVHVPGASGWHACMIKHSGWVGSVVLLTIMLSVNEWCMGVCQAAAFLAALDAVCSDLLGLVPRHSGADSFHCGNFGLVLLSKEHRDKVLQILKEMVRITMMRGAQSGGVITYVKKGSTGVRGIRSRVVNGKRTDLSELVTKKLGSDQRGASLLDGPRIYAGHTRFATTSKATFDGTHPHQWTPPEAMTVWRRNEQGAWTNKTENVENFICHNGDLDAFEVSLPPPPPPPPPPLFPSPPPSLPPHPLHFPPLCLFIFTRTHTHTGGSRNAPAGGVDAVARESQPCAVPFSCRLLRSGWPGGRAALPGCLVQGSCDSVCVCVCVCVRVKTCLV